MARGVVAFALLLASALATGAAPPFPPLTGRVVDAAQVLSTDTRRQLDARLAAHEAKTTNQVVVVTIPDLQGHDIADYGYQLGRAWGIGQKDKNNGALLIVAPNEHVLRIEVGYGLEGTLTDALSSDIVRNTIVPHFRQNDIDGGVVAGVDRMLAALEGDAAAQALASNPPEQQAPGWLGWLFIVLVILFFVLPLIGGGRGGGFIVGGLGGFGGLGGGGGFGGGGGSFGGGGASGRW